MRIDAAADVDVYEGKDIKACEASGITAFAALLERGTATAIANGRLC